VIAQVVREAAGEARGTIVLLHGRGADEHDLIPLLGVLDPKHRYRGITLGAPLTMPPGGKHWYAVHRVGWPDPATFDPTYAELTGVLDDELALD
jgi:phospholipase/carboxylesterase